MADPAPAVVEQHLRELGDDAALDWVITDVLNNTPWFFKGQWFADRAAESWFEMRHAVKGEALQHRSITRTAQGTEVVVTRLTEQALEWWRARRVLEQLRGAS